MPESVAYPRGDLDDLGAVGHGVDQLEAALVQLQRDVLLPRVARVDAQDDTLRLLCGPEGEEDGKVRRELPGEGLSEGQQEVGAGADEPGVLAAAAHPLEGRRRRLEVPRLRHRQRVHRT